MNIAKSWSAQKKLVSKMKVIYPIKKIILGANNAVFSFKEMTNNTNLTIKEEKSNPKTLVKRTSALRKYSLIGTLVKWCHMIYIMDCP